MIVVYGKNSKLLLKNSDNVDKQIKQQQPIAMQCDSAVTVTMMINTKYQGYREMFYNTRERLSMSDVDGC